MKSKETITICGIPVGRKKPVICAITNGVITKVKEDSRDNSIDIGDEDTIIAPLLFDIQVNGGFGISIQDEDLSENKLLELTEKLFRLGIVRWVPTIVSNSIEKTEFLCNVIRNALKKNKELSFAIPGIHLEGPWISPEDGPRGAHAKEYIRPPSKREFEKYYRLADGKILYVTLAPETKKAIPFIQYLISKGVCVSLGHHNASLSLMQDAVEAGATLCTHIGNGIQNYIHRHNNPIWYSLVEDRLSVSVIADGHHLPPTVLKIIAKCKKPDNIILVSDATKFMGMSSGVYKEFGSEVELKKNGKLCLKGTPYLAGSASSLLDCIPIWQRNTLNSWDKCFKCASSIPAKLLKVKMPHFRMCVGAKAYFICVKMNREQNKLIPIGIFCNAKNFLNIRK